MRLLAALAALLLAAPALAQSTAGAVVPVPLTAQERAVILAMCPAAVWANRQQFDGLCDYFKTKFETAERDAKAAESKPEKKE